MGAPNELFLGPPQVAGVDLARDPNMPTKAEQYRILCVQTVAQVLASSPETINPKTIGTDIKQAADVLYKYVDRG